MRVLQVGYGVIGKEIASEYAPRLRGATMAKSETKEHGVRIIRATPIPPRHTFMVTDLREEVPAEYTWDGEPVDLAVIVVNTPRAEGGGFDHSQLLTALRQYEKVAQFLLIRSTVTPSFLDTAFYRAFADRIGFSPEFYGATQYSRRANLDMGFSIWTENVPAWFVDTVRDGDVMTGTPIEVILAKLAENAFLATKVTFFHELALAADRLGANSENVRRLVASDPRIAHGHTYMQEPGWTSHCFDKDVPEYAAYADSDLVRAAMLVNRGRLLPQRKG